MVSFPARALRSNLMGRLHGLVQRHGEAYLARARGGGTQRELVHADADMEVWLLAWLPDHTTSIHDHGGAVTATAVLDGALLEERFVRAGFGVRAAGTVRRAAGDYDELDEGAIHRVRALGRTITLHAYAPRALDGRELEETR